MSTTTRVRIDKWLWAARFYKSRSLATTAVEGGHVHVNHARIKPSRAVAAGDCVQITKRDLSIEVEVLALAERRGPATEAEKLYRETEQSLQMREQLRQQHNSISASRYYAGRKRPDKRDRRRIRTMLGKD